MLALSQSATTGDDTEDDDDYYGDIRNVMPARSTLHHRLALVSSGGGRIFPPTAITRNGTNIKQSSSMITESSLSLVKNNSCILMATSYIENKTNEHKNARDRIELYSIL